VALFCGWSLVERRVSERLVVSSAFWEFCRERNSDRSETRCAVSSQPHFQSKRVDIAKLQ